MSIGLTQTSSEEITEGHNKYQSITILMGQLRTYRNN